MNEVFRLALLVAAGLLVALSCRAHAAAPSRAGESPEAAARFAADRYDSKETAKRAVLGRSLRGYIWPKGDHDFYRIDLPSAGVLRIRHAGLAPDCASAVKVMGERGTVLRWTNGERGKDNIVKCPVPEGGTYWIEVADSKDNNYSTKPYTLELDFQPVVDSNEWNGDERHATRLRLPATVEGYLFPQRDRDCFLFELPGRGCLRIILTGMEAEAGSRLMLLGENGLKVTGEGSRFNHPRAGGWLVDRKLGYQKRLVNVNRRGLYLLLLEPVRSFLSLQPYRLRLDFHPATLDNHEDNDSIARASLVCPGERIEGHILPARDKDYYKVYIRGHGRLLVRQSRIADELGSVLDVIDPRNGRSLCGGPRVVQPGTPENEVEVEIPGWGWYVVLVASPDSKYASIDAYELSLTFFNRQRSVPGIPAVQGFTETRQ